MIVFVEPFFMNIFLEWAVAAGFLVYNDEECRHITPPRMQGYDISFRQYYGGAQRPQHYYGNGFITNIYSPDAITLAKLRFDFIKYYIEAGTEVEYIAEQVGTKP